MLIITDKYGIPQPITDYDDLCIKHKQDGRDEMSFTIDVTLDQYKLIYEEAKIVSDDNEWLVKKIDDDKIDCELNFDFLKGTFYKDFRSETQFLTQVLQSHLPAGWTVEGAGVSSIRRTIEFDFCTDFDILYRCMSVYGVFFVWKIKEKRLIVYSQTDMPVTGEYLTSELNLKKLSFKGDTTEFATRLYAYGKDGMTMEEAVINGSRYGLTYVENKQYANKTICAYWSDERYTIPENLYEDAVKKLESVSAPVRSYECDVVDLAKQSAEYSFLDFSLHKKVTLIDIDRGIRIVHQIVEYVEYPDDPRNNKVTLSCVPQTISSSIDSAISYIDNSVVRMQTDYESRILIATAMLTGAFGSYPYSDGSNLYMMDDPDPDEAEVVWIINYKGIGKSSTGINGPYTTAITYDDHFITEVINAMVIRGELIEAGSIKSGSISQSYKSEVTSEINETVNSAVSEASTTLTQEFTAADGQVRSEIATSESNMRTLIQQTADSIYSTVSRYDTSDYTISIYSNGRPSATIYPPVNYNNKYYLDQSTGKLWKSNGTSWTLQTTLSTLQSKIEQNADNISLIANKNSSGTVLSLKSDAVKIAWNNVSKYIQFESGELRIYDSANVSTQQLVSKFNYSGSHFYHSGTYVGKIGTNNFSGKPNFKGLVFDLNYGAEYMCWAHQENKTDSDYSVEMIYYADDTEEKRGIHFSCPTYVWGNLRINEYVRSVNWSSGAGGWYSDTKEVGLYGPSARVKVNSDIDLYSDYGVVSCHTNLDMNNHSIVNTCDARLKTNIAPSDVRAVDVINSLEAMSFDWIENEEHNDIGFIAQQVQSVLPDVVVESTNDGKLSIDYIKLIPYLVKAIQELYARSAAKPSSQKKKTAPWSDPYSKEEKKSFFDIVSGVHRKKMEEVARSKIKIPINEVKKK